MAELKPAYLVCGDDDAKIDAWRPLGAGRNRTGDPAVWRPSTQGPATRARWRHLSVLSFDPATRYLLVDDVGAWKAGQLAPLEAALTALPPDTVLVLVVRGRRSSSWSRRSSRRWKSTVTRRQSPVLPKWCVERARELGLQLDGEAAKGLVALWAPASSA